MLQNVKKGTMLPIYIGPSYVAREEKLSTEVFEKKFEFGEVVGILARKL